MKNFCTVADYNFRRRVWALNQSLLTHSDKYILHVLALDDKSYAEFSKDCWKNKNIRPVFVDDLLSSDEHLLRCSKNSPSYEALNVASGDINRATWMQFVWSLSPYFTWYCLEHYDIEDIFTFSTIGKKYIIT